MNDFPENTKFNVAVEEYKKNNILNSKKILIKILEKNKFHFNALFLLGTIFAQLKNFKESNNLFLKALTIKPENQELLNNLGNINYEIGNYNQAINFFKKSIFINNKFDKAYYNLAMTYKELNNFKDSEINYKKAISINPENLNACNNLAGLLAKLNRFKESMKYYKKILKNNPKYANAFCGIANIFRATDQTNKAIINYQKAIDLEPKNLSFRWLDLTIFPKIYQDTNEQKYFRERFEKKIETIESLINNEFAFNDYLLIEALQSSTNFLLSYQVENDLKLQIKYANLVTSLSNKIFKNKFLNHKSKNYNSNKKIKIGFISSNFKFHSVSKTFKNWIININKNLFESFIFHIGNDFDEISNTIKNSTNNFFSHTSVIKLAKKITFENLNILIFLDIGMDPKVQILASQKLAQIQCCTWGHPSTSGFKSIDYFFSSQLMETTNSQNYYSEKLLCLPSIGTVYDKINIKKIDIKNAIKRTDTIKFLSNHSLFKLLPKNDHIFFDIQKKINKCEFHFFEGENKYITYKFIKRLKKLCLINNIIYENFFYFHKRAEYKIYLKILNQSDIILDNFGFSGFNTGIEAINLNKPIITMPGKYMRGKLVYAILKKIDLEILIANSKKEYVNIASKLAKNKELRNTIIYKIKKNKDKLYKDENYINDLEKIILDKIIN